MLSMANFASKERRAALLEPTGSVSKKLKSITNQLLLLYSCPVPTAATYSCSGCSLNSGVWQTVKWRLKPKPCSIHQGMCSNIGLHSLSMPRFSSSHKDTSWAQTVLPVHFCRGVDKIIYLTLGTRDVSRVRRRVPVKNCEWWPNISFSSFLRKPGFSW